MGMIFMPSTEMAPVGVSFSPFLVMSRIRISDRKLETVLDMRSLGRLSIGTFVSWSGLAPDDSILLSRNISTQEIYALKW